MGAFATIGAPELAEFFSIVVFTGWILKGEMAA